jgi:integrase
MAKMVRTRDRGIYKRGSRYVVVYYVNGRQRKEAARTLKEARALKRARETDRDRGELQSESRIAFRTYAEEWIERYHGNGRRGFTDDTRDDYRRDLARYAYPFLDDRLGRTVSSITPRDVSRWIGWVADEKAQGRRLADGSIRRIVAPVRSCLATAKREGLIRANPVDGAALPKREEIVEDGEEHVRVFTREQLEALLRIAHPRHRLFFGLLAATGLRWGEAVALRWRDLELELSPRVKVRRAEARRRKGGPRYKSPKSKRGRRDVPIDATLARDLRRHRAESEWADDDDLVFTSTRGTALDYSAMRRRYLEPAASEAGCEWAGFHTFRHTFASMHVERGTSIVQLSALLGHHSPDFTLRRYAHLIPGDEADPLSLGTELPSGNEVAIDGAAREGTERDSEIAEVALASGSGN